MKARTRTRIETTAAIYDRPYNQSLNEQKLQTITGGLQRRYSRLFTEILRENAIALADFRTSVNTEINLSEKHKMNMIEVVNSLSKIHCRKRSR